MHRRHIVTVVAAMLVTVLPAVAQEQPAESRAEEQDTCMTVVLDSERSSNTDIILLRNGDKLTGTILNKAFGIRTSYASLSFNNGMIAGIDLEGGANNIEAIITVNNNRFSGFIDDPVFVFKLQSGTQVEIRREKVLKAIFRVREAERSGIPQRQFIILKNGDFFSGKVLTEKLTLGTTYAKISIQLRETESITLIGANNPLTKVLLRNQDTVQGVLETEDIEIELDVGPKVAIYQDRIDVIYTTEGFVPADIAGASRSQVGGLVKTASGLQYAVLRQSDGPRPGPTDTVKVHYRGTKVDGSEFDSSYTRGSPSSFPLNRVIKGWTEGIQLMSVGCKYRFVIPPDLAYGKRGAGGKIGPNEILIFEVELLAIE